VAKYSKTEDTESAYDILTNKIKAAAEEAPAVSAKGKKQEEDKSIVEQITDNPIARSMVRTAGNMLVRGLLGSLGLGSTRSRKKGFF
jgi:hypothetical protein